MQEGVKKTVLMFLIFSFKMSAAITKKIIQKFKEI